MIDDDTSGTKSSKDTGGLPNDAKSALAQKALGRAAERFGDEFEDAGTEAGVVAARAAHVILKPLRAAVWGAERISDWLEASVAERLKQIPQEKIVEPNPRIAIPAMEALTYSNADEIVREMFASLLTSDMVSDTKDLTHPSFVQLIKEMTGIDAKTLSYVHRNGDQVIYDLRAINPEGSFRAFSSALSFYLEECQDYEILIRSIYNLIRLGLFEINESTWPISPEWKEKDEKISKALNLEEHRRQDPQRRWELNKDRLHITPYGRSFVAVCLTGTSN
jgi:hypothetical protein